MNPSRISLTALMVVLSTAQTEAVPILDVEINPTTPFPLASIFIERDTAQTYRHGLSGQLTKVDLLLSRTTDAVGDLLFDVRPTTLVSTQHKPVDNDALAMANAMIPQAHIPLNTPSFVSIDLSGEGIFVSAGEVLALVLTAEQSGPSDHLWFDWHGTGTSSFYLNGQRFFRDDPATAFTGTSGDLGIRVFVVPELSSLTMVGCLLILAGSVRPRNQKQDKNDLTRCAPKPTV